MNTNKATFSEIVIDNVKTLESTINQTTKINSDKLKQTSEETTSLLKNQYEFIESEKHKTIAILQGIKEDSEGNLDKLLNDRYLISKNSNSKQL